MPGICQGACLLPLALGRNSEIGAVGLLSVPGIHCLAIQLHQLVSNADVSLLCRAALSNKGHTGSLLVARVRQHLEAQANNLPICRICQSVGMLTAGNA